MTNLQKKFEQAKSLKLFPESRKSALRQKLQAHMTLNPLPNTGLWSRLIGKFSTRTLSVIVVFLALLVLGAGTVTAANRAMPGQVLYSVKTQINEPAHSLLIFDADTKAAYEADLAAKRADEAEQLFNSGKLDERTQEQLSNNFDIHVKEVQNRLGQLQGDDSKDTQALLDQAKDKLKNKDYKQAAKLGRQISATARKSFKGDRGNHSNSGE